MLNSVLTDSLTYAKLTSMTISEYLKENKIKGKDFADTLEISQAYLSQLCGGVRKPSKYLALIIEQKTRRAVKATELRPDIKKGVKVA